MPAARANDVRPVDTDWSLNPDQLSRLPVRDLQIGRIPLGSRWSYGVRLSQNADFSEPLDIPDLGSNAMPVAGDFNAGAMAQDIQAASNPLLSRSPKKSALRMNWVNVDTPDYRIEFNQQSSRTRLRFVHPDTGLRFEAERRLVNSSTHLFIGVRLIEERNYESTLGCSSTSGNPLETRRFCGLRYRLGL